MKIRCANCAGLGYVPQHGDHNDDGNCVNCPIQEPCEVCEGTGIVEEKELTKTEIEEAVNREESDEYDRNTAHKS